MLIRWIPALGTRVALPYKPIRDVPFFRVSFFSINSWTGYENWSNGLWLFVQEQKSIVLKNNRLLFSLLFCNLKIPKQGIKMQTFFLNGLWRLLKNGHLSVKLHSSAPPGLGTVALSLRCFVDEWILTLQICVATNLVIHLRWYLVRS